MGYYVPAFRFRSIAFRRSISLAASTRAAGASSDADPKEMPADPDHRRRTILRPLLEGSVESNDFYDLAIIPAKSSRKAFGCMGIALANTEGWADFTSASISNKRPNVPQAGVVDFIKVNLVFADESPQRIELNEIALQIMHHIILPQGQHSPTPDYQRKHIHHSCTRLSFILL